MTGILVDTSVLIDYFKDELPGEAEKLLEQHPLSISIITFIEACKYFYAAGKGGQWEKEKDKLESFGMIGVDSSTGEHAARLAALQKMSLADSIIYATAISHNLTLLTSDAEFKNKKQVIFVAKR